MNRINKILIAIGLIVIIVLITLAIFVTINLKNKEDTIPDVPEDIVQDIDNYEATYKLDELKNVANIMTVNNCINTYLKYIKENNYKGIYDISIPDYLETNNITEQNILSEKIEVNDDTKYLVNKAFEYDNGFYLKTYFSMGYLINNKEKENLNFVINVDSKNRTFEISPLEQVYSGYINKISESEIMINENKFKNVIKEIQPNEYNLADIAVGIGDLEVMRYYFEQYIQMMLYSPDIAYKLLDIDYRQKRFGSYTGFEEYVQECAQYLKTSVLVKFKIEEYSNYKEYLCQDGNGNVYIFKEKSPLDFNVLLDQYTEKDKIFYDEYLKQNESSKAQMNLNKFKQMLNMNDYSSAYEVLNKDFKTKYFDTLEKFVEYVKDNFYRYNSFEYTEVFTENSKYKITTQVVNIQGSYKDNFVKRFKVELLNQTDFSISFDI